MAYPDDLKTTINKLTNYSRSSVKIQNETSGDVVSGNQLKFRLPSNSLIDLSSLAVHCHMKTVSTGAEVGGVKVAYIPCRDLNIIRRLTVEMENNTVCVIENYDRVRAMMLDYSMGEANHKFNLYGHGDVNNINVNGVAIGVAPNANAGFDQDIILDRFISFLSGSPSYVDTSVTGALMVTIDLVPASECLFKNGVSTANCTNAPEYTLSKICATITKCSIQDGFYFNAIQSSLAQGLPFKLRFPYYESTISQEGPQTMSMRTDIQSDSIDMVFFSFMHSSANAKQTTNKDVSRYSEPTNSHKYLNRSLQDVTGLQFNVNGMTIPSYTMDKPAMYNQLLSDLGCKNDRDGGFNSLVTVSSYNWSHYFGMATLSLHHPTANPDLISGLSSESTPCQISVDCQSTGASGTNWVGVLTVQSTRLVECYSGRNIILIR